MEGELRADPDAAELGDLRPAPGLLELRPAVYGDLRILFAVEPPGTALLIAVLEGRDAVVEHYDEAVRLSSDVLRRVRAGQDPEAAAHVLADADFFLAEFFPGQAAEIGPAQPRWWPGIRPGPWPSSGSAWDSAGPRWPSGWACRRNE